MDYIPEVPDAEGPAAVAHVANNPNAEEKDKIYHLFDLPNEVGESIVAMMPQEDALNFRRSHSTCKNWMDQFYPFRLMIDDRKEDPEYLNSFFGHHLQTIRVSSWCIKGKVVRFPDHITTVQIQSEVQDIHSIITPRNLHNLLQLKSLENLELHLDDQTLSSANYRSTGYEFLNLNKMGISLDQVTDFNYKREHDIIQLLLQRSSLPMLTSLKLDVTGSTSFEIECSIASNLLNFLSCRNNVLHLDHKTTHGRFPNWDSFPGSVDELSLKKNCRTLKSIVMKTDFHQPMWKLVLQQQTKLVKVEVELISGINTTLYNDIITKNCGTLSSVKLYNLVASVNGVLNHQLYLSVMSGCHHLKTLELSCTKYSRDRNEVMDLKALPAKLEVLTLKGFLIRTDEMSDFFSGINRILLKDVTFEKAGTSKQHGLDFSGLELMLNMNNLEKIEIDTESRNHSSDTDQNVETSKMQKYEGLGVDSQNQILLRRHPTTWSWGW